MPKTKTKNKLAYIADNYKAAVKWPTSPYQKYLGQLDEYVDVLGDLVESSWNNNLKQIVDPMVQDAQQDQLDSQLDQLEQRMTAVFAMLGMRRKAEQMAQQVRQRAVLAFQDDMQKILGDQFKPSINYRNLEPFIKQTIRRNVSLIKSIPRQYHDDIQRVIYEGIRKGNSVTEIKEALDNTLDVAQGRTTTISQDQVGSLQGSLTKKIHTDIGLEQFRWWTMGDEDVRASHVPRHGEVYSWSDLPGGEYPGSALNCRCYASPYESEVQRKFAQQGVGAIAV